MKKTKKKSHCSGCIHAKKNNNVFQCALFGVLTLELEKQCKKSGWKHWRVDHGTRKVPHYPPCI